MRTELRIFVLRAVEITMWTAAAGAILGIWALWPTTTSKPHSLLGVLSHADEREPEGRQKLRWPERTHVNASISLSAAGHSVSSADKFADGHGGPLLMRAQESESSPTTQVADISTTAPIKVHDALEVAAEPPADHRDDAAFNKELSAPDIAPSPMIINSSIAEPASGPPLDTPEIAMGGVSSLSMLATSDAETVTDSMLAAVAHPPGQPDVRSVSPGVAVYAGEEVPHSVDLDLPLIDVPAVELVWSEAPTPAETFSNPQPLVGRASASTGASDTADRELLITKGEEMLAAGNVSGARLFFQRAVDTGDARAARGMARTFDPDLLRTLRVYGVRPDALQAAQWYNRAKILEGSASTTP